MAKLTTVSEDYFIKNEGKDALPGCSEKPFQSPNLHLSPKHENVPLLNLPSILGPGKFEYNTQKLEPKYPDHEEVKAENETFGTKELNQLSNPDHTPKNTLSFLEPVEDPEFGFYEMASMALKKSSTSPVN
ncbi:uncharacterized protein LOC136026012 isoform X2 [Artemia franciscana]|uniref:uncharacterized protein LOC136026012 isoform X2 n=1 Tax=Artemia franciscana TaxID=6661 RepID=UPI0032DB4C67